MVATKIKTERTMTLDGNWTEAEVTVQNHMSNEHVPDLSVGIRTSNGLHLFLLDELRAIVAFAESEVARIESEWEAERNA